MPREVIVEMRDRLIAGETWPVIADALGISVRSIARTLKDAGGMPPRWTDRPTCQLSLADREYVFAIYLDRPAPYPPVMMLPDGSGTLAVVSMREPRFSAEVLNGNLVGPVIMVTKPKHDDPVIIASVWFVEVSGTAPDLTVKTVTTSYRCRGGQLRQPGYECV